jgi:bifunctional UDP-N-acetylglucosamine pyrophosphorylase/glucosamine-1-phosphate N-acetyltransferase
VQALTGPARWINILAAIESASMAVARNGAAANVLVPCELSMNQSSFASVILAAGSGTRMKSALPKVMHRIAGRPMIGYLLEALQPLVPATTTVVLGPQMGEVARMIAPVETVVQDPPLGTGDAVSTALHAFDGRPAPQGRISEVLILYGDTPFLTTETMLRLLDERRRTAAAVLVAGMRPADPASYGRFIFAPDGTLERIVEATDANTEERAIGLVNGGIMVIKARHARDLVDALDRNNAKREFYLTDVVEIARRKGLSCRAIELPVEELIGVNSRPDLAKAEALMQRRLRRRNGCGRYTGSAGDSVLECGHEARPL